RFSRPPRSTTLPPLQFGCKYRVKNRISKIIFRKIKVKTELFHILSILAYNLEAAQAFNFKKRT
ncbi:hypothetical protein DW936_20160, partial [Odoribacter splanchnicus]